MKTRPETGHRSPPGLPGETLHESASRLAFLDNLRIGLTVLVVLHHVAMAYGAAAFDFYFVDFPESFISRNLLVFVLTNQAWFMGAFFLVSGYFTPGSYDRKGPVGFLRSRIVRLGIPLVVYSFVLNPVAMTGAFSMPDEINPLSWATFDWLEHAGMGPGWFLALLLIFSGGYAAWRVGVPSRTRPRATTPPGPAVLAAAALTLAVAGFLLRTQISVGETVWEFPSLAYLPQYVSFFAFGALAARRDWLRLLPLRTGLIGIGAAAAAWLLLFPLVFSGQMFSLELTEELTLAMGEGTWQSAVYALWDSILSIGLTLGLIVVLRTWWDRQGSLGRYLARTSYAVYLIHIPIVVYLAVALSHADLGHTTKVGLAALLAVPVCFATAGVIRKIPGASRII